MTLNLNGTKKAAIEVLPQLANDCATTLEENRALKAVIPSMKMNKLLKRKHLTLH